MQFYIQYVHALQDLSAAVYPSFKQDQRHIMTPGEFLFLAPHSTVLTRLQCQLTFLQSQAQTFNPHKGVTLTDIPVSVGCRKGVGSDLFTVKDSEELLS